jgi:predicted amidohydrolase YtcJ
LSFETYPHVLDSVLRVYTHLKPRFLPVGAIIVPGLVESHAHLLDYGRSRALNLDGTKNIDEVLARVREYVLSKRVGVHGAGAKAGNRPDEEWIEGVGWDQNLWEGWRGGFPTAVSV